MRGEIVEISYLRVLAMLMIVMFHCLCLNAGIWSFIFDYNYVRCYRIFANFLNLLDLPIFFFVAGYLYSFLYDKGVYPNAINFLFKKIQRLLLPYILWGILMIALMPQLCNLGGLVNGLGHLWFLLSLFITFVFFDFIQRFTNNFSFLLCVFLCVILVLSYDIASSQSHLPMFVNAFWRYSPIFYIGLLSDKYKVFKKINKVTGKIDLFVIPISLLAELLFIVNIPFIGRLLQILLVCSSIILLYDFISRMHLEKKKRINDVISNLDKNSMGIYILHHIFIWLLFCYTPYLSFMNAHVILGPLFLFLSVFGVSWALVNFINKYSISKWIFG